MLLSFSVANFRSFREEQTLNLLASKRLGATEQSPHCCPVPGTDEHVLRIGSLYGANGAGKSNLVGALFSLQRLVLDGTPRDQLVAYNPFLLDEESHTKPTSFELRFVEQGNVFRYGICCDAERVHEEWLDVYEGKKERNLFSRTTTEDGTVTVELGPAAGNVKTLPKMHALAEVGARSNQLFLTEVVNMDDPEAQGPRFQYATQWFSSTLSIIKPNAPFVALVERMVSDEEFAGFAGCFLREASTGIASLGVETEELEASGLSPRFLERMRADLPPGAPVVLPGPCGEEIVIEEVGKGKVTRRRIVALHEAGARQPMQLRLQEESDGSQRLLNLLPALYHLTRHNGVFVIDELERSMHPMLARKFVEFFLKAVPGARSQLIFTTHESTLLDLDLMRRDGIWFAEKDQEGATHLYSLADFKVRNDLRIDKGYLQGRFGAIPFLGGIDHLIEEQAAVEIEK